MSSRSLPRSPREPTRAPLFGGRRASPACARPRPAITRAASASTLDPDSEVIVTLGSKEGLANLAQAITAPGDVVLAPNPSYPIHTFGFIIAGAAIRSIPAAPGPRFLRVGSNVSMRYTVPRPKVLVIGYPSNPTAYIADLAFYEQVVAFAREHDLMGDLRPRLCRNLFRRRRRRPRSSRCRARRRSRSSSPRCPRPIRWPAGGSASRSAIRG